MDEATVSRLIAEYAKRYDSLITIDEACAIARKATRKTVYDWSSRGLLDDVKTRCGRNVLFDRDGFVRFVLTNDHPCK